MRLLLLLLLLLAFPNSASASPPDGPCPACDCIGAPRVLDGSTPIEDQAFREALDLLRLHAAVFVGEVVRIDTTGGPRQNRVYFETSRSWKVPPSGAVLIQGWGLGNCVKHFAVGNTYIVFAQVGTPPFEPGDLFAHTCGFSSLLETRSDRISLDALDEAQAFLARKRPDYATEPPPSWTGVPDSLRLRKAIEGGVTVGISLKLFDDETNEVLDPDPSWFEVFDGEGRRLEVPIRVNDPAETWTYIEGLPPGLYHVRISVPGYAVLETAPYQLIEWSGTYPSVRLRRSDE